MKKEKIQKIINTSLITMLLQIFLTALFHDVLSDKLFIMFHVMPGFAFIVFVGIHILLNRKTAKNKSL